MKVKQALSGKFDSSFGKRKTQNTDRIINGNSDETSNKAAINNSHNNLNTVQYKKGNSLGNSYTYENNNRY